MRGPRNSHHRARGLTIVLLVLALLPTPWPKVEFHNVRHQDAPGQVCEYHDHLLRWHPDATGADDVEVLHFHWAWPSPDPSNPGHEGDGLRLHAHLADASLLSVDSGPVIVADTSVRLISPAAPASLLLYSDFSVRPPRVFRPNRSGALSYSATFAPRTSLTSRLHRWSC